MRSLVVIVVLGLESGCKSATHQECTELATVFSSCGAQLESAATDVRRTCEVALGTPAEPLDAGPPSLQELERCAFVECSHERSCSAVSACLARHGCSFILLGPSDTHPHLECGFSVKAP